MCFFFFKQKTAYELRISDWSSDVCSSDLIPVARKLWLPIAVPIPAAAARRRTIAKALAWGRGVSLSRLVLRAIVRNSGPLRRSEEHTSELQSLMRISYAVFCLKKKKQIQERPHKNIINNTLCIHDTYKKPS